MATSVDFHNILGFYVPIGGTDYPRSWSPNKPFGFDPHGTVPVYRSSFNDVVNVFDTPVTTTKQFSTLIDPSGLLSSLTIQRPVDDFDMVAVGSDNPNDTWAAVFRIIEYVYYNQDVVTVESFEGAVVNLLATVSTVFPYIMHSIMLSKRVGSSRIEFFEFTMNFNSAGTPTDNVSFKIYFNPDSLISNESAGRYKVYFYEDLNGDNIITNSEWESQIVDKTIGIFNTGNYKYYKPLQTKFVYNDPVTGTLKWYTQLFIVYTISNDFTNDQVINAVKEFLLSYVHQAPGIIGHIYSYQECVFHYPDLFLTRTVNLFPVNNVIVGSGNSNGTYIAPVTYSLIYSTLSRFVAPGYANFDHAEIIYVGNESITPPNFTPFPVWAVSSIQTDDIKPISVVYQDFAPMYIPFTSFNDPAMTPEQIFHHLVRLALNVIIGKMTDGPTGLVHDAIVNTTPSFGFAIAYNGPNNAVSTVTFNYQGTVYCVNAMVS